jgi:hypothetical protein
MRRVLGSVVHGRSGSSDSGITKCKLRSRAEIIVLWKRAKEYVLRILRLRKRFASLGRHLQEKRIRKLVSGLTRVKGVLKRVSVGSDDGLSVPVQSDSEGSVGGYGAVS